MTGPGAGNVEVLASVEGGLNKLDKVVVLFGDIILTYSTTGRWRPVGSASGDWAMIAAATDKPSSWLTMSPAFEPAEMSLETSLGRVGEE